MMKNRSTGPAVLFALLPVYPILNFYANNLVIISPGTIVLVSLLTVTCTLVLGLLTGLLTRRYAASMAAAAAVMILLLSNGQFRALLVLIGFPPAETTRFVLQGVLHLFFVLLSIGVWISVRRNENVLHALAVITVVLLLLPLPEIFAYHSREESPEVTRTEDATLTFLPDSSDYPHIIMLLLDGYARADVLRDVYGYDNGKFITELRARNFFVADSAATNHTQTILSLTTLFTMQPLDLTQQGRLRPGESGNNARQALVDVYRLADVWRILGAAGYIRLVTAMYGVPAPTEVDIILRNKIMRDIDLGLFAEETSWIFFRKLLSYDPRRNRAGDVNDFTFELLDIAVDIARDRRPSLLFAHILAPHPPFTLSAGSERSRDRFPYIKDGSHYHQVHGTTPADYVAGYREELAALNDHVLKKVDEIISSERPLILLLLSDHGPGAFLDWEDRSKSNIKERMASFFAVYSSHGDVTGFPHRITPVNVFPVLFNSHFGTDYPLHENHAWFSTWTRPFQLHDVSEEVW
ncbi:MAG: hypothetical protein KFH87_04380 [Bacteroidetes bacterium]|nr:hypothetical protein [Bacteroidota bacterium]